MELEDSCREGAPHEENTKENPCKRVVSVTTTIATLCLFGILTTGVLTAVLSELSCDTALSDTRHGCDHATDQCFSTAETSLELTVYEILGYAAVGVEGMIDQYLESAVDEGRRLNVMVNETLASTDKSGPGFIPATGPQQWMQMKSLIRGSGEFGSAVKGVGVYADSNFLAIHNMPTGLVSFVKSHLLFLMPDRGTYASPTVPITGMPDYTAEWASDTNPTGAALLKATEMDVIGIPEARQGIMPLNEMRWSHVGIVGSYMGYTIITRLTDPTVQHLETVVYVSVANVDNFVKNAAEEARKLKPGSMPRIFVTVASSWHAKFLRDQGNPDYKKYEQDGLLLGTSSGPSLETYIGDEPLTGLANWTLFRPVADVNASDPLIRGLAREIRAKGGYESVITAPKGHKTLTVTRNESGVVITDSHLVGVRRLPRLPEGIDLFTTMTLDTESVLALVRSQQSMTKHAISEQKQDVTDSVVTERRTMKLIIGGSALALLILSIYITHVVLDPIKRVQKAMSRVACMELEGNTVKVDSRLFEVRQMQRDFTTMVDSLKEFRAYVPSAVLGSRGAGSSSNELTIATPPTGNIAVLFTDIQGSTALWDRSAADMNVALEQHNDTIRALYSEFGGYEVKTIGDAFMVSFVSPVKALGFALQVQQNLSEHTWPSKLDLPAAGLVIRIGINYGPTIAESNPVTGRVDYRGGTVNMASRVEAKAKGGTVCISSDMLAAVRSELPSLGNPAVQKHGMHELKGLGQHELHLLVPQGMRKRLNDNETDCCPKTTAIYKKRDTIMTVESSERGSGDSDLSEVDGGRSSVTRTKKKMAIEKTRLQLNRSNITVAVCRLHACDSVQLFDYCNIMVRAASEAALATDGIVGSVSGSTMMVVWNASKKCLMHATAALTFASQLETRASSVMHLGLATGHSLHGNVGTQKSRFATVFGLALESAEAAADFAESFGVFCMYADCSVDLNSASDMRRCLRLVDTWFEEREKRKLEIYEVDSASVKLQVENWGNGFDENANGQEYERQTTLIQSVLRGDVQELVSLRQISDKRPDDHVLQKVIRLLEEANPTDGHRCIVRLSKAPRIPMAEYTKSPSPHASLQSRHSRHSSARI